MASTMTTIFPPGKSYRRSEWCLHPAPTCGLPLNKSAMYIVITYDTPTFQCNNHDECLIALRKLYNYYVKEKNLADIPFNFLISHDGTIYEARGFNSQPSRSLKYHWKHHGNRIDIAFIGNYSAVLYPLIMTKAALDVAEEGVEAGYIDRFHEVLEHKDMEKVAESIRKEKQRSPMENFDLQQLAYRLTNKTHSYEESQEIMKGLIPEENMPTNKMCMIM